MKILTITPDLGNRGTQRVAQTFSIGFRQRGHDVKVLTLLPEGPRRAALDRAGIEIIDLSPDRSAAIESVKAFKPDVVHFHRAGITIGAETALLHDLRPHAKILAETNIFGRYDPSTADLLDLHFQITHCGLYRWSCLAPPASRRKSVGVYVPNPVDLNDFYRPPADEVAAYRRDVVRAAPGEFVFGRIGKSMPQIFQRFEQIVAREPRARLVTLHDPGLDWMIATLSPALLERITFLPATNSDAELRLFYSAIDALLHWSYNGESFGMVLAEAIGCGTPVVMPLQLHRDIGGIEVVRHMQGGIIAGNWRNLPAAAIRMMQTRETFNAPLAAARRRIYEDYRAGPVCELALDALELALQTKLAGQPIKAAFDRSMRFETRVEKAWFDRLIAARVGRTSLGERLVQFATHTPLTSAVLRRWRQRK